MKKLCLHICIKSWCIPSWFYQAKLYILCWHGIRSHQKIAIYNIEKNINNCLDMWTYSTHRKIHKITIRKPHSPHTQIYCNRNKFILHQSGREHISCFSIGIFHKYFGIMKYLNTKTMNLFAKDWSNTNLFMFLFHTTHDVIIKEQNNINTSQIWLSQWCAWVNSNLSLQQFHLSQPRISLHHNLPLWIMLTRKSQC